MSSADEDLTIRFLGVRGSIATPDPDKSRFGGNTACILLSVGQEAPVVLDAGTGIRLLNVDREPANASEVSATILFSHFHWDHIQGFPFIQSLYAPQNRFKLYSTFQPEVLERTLRGQMDEPYFPIAYSAIQAQLEYGVIKKEGLQIGSLLVKPFVLNHPGGCSGFRVEIGRRALVYATDHEHGIATVDAGIEAMCSDADLLIYDSHFTPDEYLTHQGWGHSTWKEGAKFAHRANVKKLILFHHSPGRTDTALEELLAQASNEFTQVEAAQENRCIVLPGNHVRKAAQSNRATARTGAGHRRRQGTGSPKT